MKEWDTVKFILITSIFFCLTGLGLYLYQDSALTTLNNEVPLSQRALKEIGSLRTEIDFRQTELENDKRFGKNLKLRQYVSEQAHFAGIDYDHQLRLSESNVHTNKLKGYEDHPYDITGVSKQKFHRRRIATFVAVIESDTNSRKITELSLVRPTPDCESWELSKMKIVERRPIVK